MKTFDPKDKKGHFAKAGTSGRREFSNRDDSRSSENHEATPFLKDQRREKRPRLNNRSDEPAREDRRRSFNPNFTRDNRIKTEDSFKKPYRREDREESGSRGYSSRGEGRSFSSGRGDRNRNQEGGSSYGRREDQQSDRGSNRPSREGRSSFGGGDRDSYRGGAGRFDRNDRGDRFTRGDRNDRSDRGDRFDRSDRSDRSDRGDRGGRGGAFQKNGDRKRNFKKYDSEHYPRFDAPKQTGAIRLNRFIANSGICSRREADDLIAAGVVSVNGEVVSELGTKVMPNDEIRFNGEVIHGEKKVYILMNKPKGYVTSLDDPHADKTVMDLLKNACTERVYPVGRLDKNSVGVLLVTNDGELTRQLTHPSYQKRKVYQVTLDKSLTQEDMQKLADGIELEDGPIFADEISYVNNSRKEIGVEIHSGRNRIVRRMFEALGYSVQKLDRVYFAGLTKKSLKRGAWRFLTPREVSMLKSGEYQ